MTLNDLNEKYDFIDWKLYFEKRFKEFGINDINTKNYTFINYIPKYFEEITNIINETDSTTLLYYTEW